MKRRIVLNLAAIPVLATLVIAVAVVAHVVGAAIGAWPL